MYIIGCDIGGMSIKSAIIDEKGNFIRKFVFKVTHDRTQEEMMSALGELINENIAAAGLTNSDIHGIGIGCPGSIDSTTGVCDYSNNLDWHHLPICKLIEEKTGIRCKIANDANAACLGEVCFGVAKNYKNMILITLGTGVGGGLYLDGHLFEGNHAKGAELGHSVIVMDGRQCTCGRKGCMETYASVTALMNDTKEEMKANPKSSMWDYAGGDIDKVNGLTAFESAKKGDASAQKVVDQYIHFLGEGLLNFINVFRPEAIVLGGGLSGQKESLTKPLIKYLEDREYGYGGKISPKVEILISDLGNDAGILGAASLVL